LLIISLCAKSNETLQIRKITPDGTVSTLATAIVAADIAVDNLGNIYVGDTYNNLIRKISVQ